MLPKEDQDAAQVVKAALRSDGVEFTTEQVSPSEYDAVLVATGRQPNIENLNLDDYTDKQQRALREATVKLRSLADQASVRIAPSKPKPQPEPEEDEVPYSEFLDIVFEVINPLLDTRTFNKVRKALIERFKDV